MELKNNPIINDMDIRHFIYLSFTHAGKPPTTSETSVHFGMAISAVENAFERLAQGHHIALAPGSHSIWMAHPFSGVPTNYVAEVSDKKYWGN